MLSLVVLMDFGFYLGQLLCSCAHEAFGSCPIEQQTQVPACCRGQAQTACQAQPIFEAQAEVLPACCGSEQYRFETAPFLRSEFELASLACACTHCCTGASPFLISPLLPKHFAPPSFALEIKPKQANQALDHWAKTRHGPDYLAQIQVYRC